MHQLTVQYVISLELKVNSILNPDLAPNNRLDLALHVDKPRLEMIT